MTVAELERRLTALERQVRQLQKERDSAAEQPRFDWEATVARFKNDQDVLAVLAEAMKLREKERRALRRKPKKQRAAP